MNSTLSSINHENGIIIVCFNDSSIDIEWCLSKMGYSVVAFADNSSQKQGKKKHRKKVLSVEKAVELNKDSQFLVVVEKYYEELKKQLEDLGVNKENIIKFDMYSNMELKHMFPRRWFCEDKYYIYHNPLKRGVRTYYLRIRNYLKSIFYNKIFEEYTMDRKKYYSSICAIFKNEAPYLKEWLDFYRKVGINHIFLYNNNSEDDYYEKVKDYIDDGFVSLYEWPQKQGQMDAYKDCITKNKSITNWIGFFDLDEFVTPISYPDINSFLKNFEKYGSIIIPELVFGSSGYVDREISEPVLQVFTSCWKKHSNVGKCFFNTDFEIDYCKEEFFNHYTWTIKNGKRYPSVNVFKQVCFIDYMRGKNVEFPIDLKHYVIKSTKEYEKKKNGTDAVFKDNPHTDNAFYFHDIRSVDKNNEMIKYINIK